MKKILLLIVALFLTSCNLEPKIIEDLSETKKQEILERGYFLETDFDNKNITKTAIKNENISNNINISDNKNIIKEIKKEFNKIKSENILNIEKEINKIKLEEISKIETELKKYNLSEEEYIKYKEEELKKLNSYFKRFKR